MTQSPIPILGSWINFYEIVGSAAGALTGLQFVVIALISNTDTPGDMRAIRAFGTPTVLHFCMALLIAALMSVPWQSLYTLGIWFGVCGLAGLIYSIGSIRHAQKAEYNPDKEDWFWFVGLPIAMYATLVGAAVLFWWDPAISLFSIAATSLLFLFTGIHNAWDTVTYIAVQRKNPSRISDE